MSPMSTGWARRRWRGAGRWGRVPPARGGRGEAEGEGDGSEAERAHTALDDEVEG